MLHSEEPSEHTTDASCSEENDKVVALWYALERLV